MAESCNKEIKTMLKIVILLAICFPFIISCHSNVRVQLLNRSKDDRVVRIEYEASRKYGNYFNAIKSINGKNIHYSLKVNDDGKLLHVIKYYNGREPMGENDLEYYRDLQFLVTDTSIINGPNFFGHSINGYYDNTFLVNNVIFDTLTRIEVSPLLKEELALFTLIDSLAKANSISYKEFDRPKVIGWFKYVF